MLHDTINGSYSVSDIDTISTLSGDRKRLFLYLIDSLSIEDGVLDRNLVWIDGIGSTYGPLYPKTIPLKHEVWSTGTCLEAVYSFDRTQVYQGYCNVIGGYWPDQCKFITSHIHEAEIITPVAHFNVAGDLEIMSESTIMRVCIYDLNGKQLYDCMNTSGKGHFIIPNNFAIGVYLCDFYFEANEKSSLKVLKSFKCP